MLRDRRRVSELSAPFQEGVLTSIDDTVVFTHLSARTMVGVRLYHTAAEAKSHAYDARPREHSIISVVS